MTNTIESRTICNILKWAIITLQESGIEYPELNADTLLAYALSCDKTRLYIQPDDVIDENDICNYKELIFKRTKHVPLQYLIRKVEFMSLDFVVDERVLIPRPETEILVETILKRAQAIKVSSKNIIIVEIGSGSGNIAVSLAKLLNNAVIYSNDISSDALILAKTNSQKHAVLNRVHLLHGDFFGVFSNVVKHGHADFIVSNPPYVSEYEWNNLEPEVKEHEPKIALVGGKDGLNYYRRIIRDAPGWLRSGGFLIVEIGETQADAVKHLMQNEGHYGEIEIINDLQGKERVISARRK